MSDNKAMVTIDIQIGVSLETANHCLHLIEWYLDQHPDEALRIVENTKEDGKVRHFLFFGNK